MSRTDYAGIDYGLGQSNIDHETGIRYGVISQNCILQAWADSSEADYGEPHCPKCGNPADDIDQAPDLEDENHGWTIAEYECWDYCCTSCRYVFGPESAFGDEPLGFTYDADGIKAFSDSSGDVWVIKSPYYTRAQFCSPCAPGACHLENPTDKGERAYCFPADWFDDDVEPCPYPIWRVDNDELVYTPTQGDSE